MTLESAEFESFVNSERCKTLWMKTKITKWFESFVNSERCKTFNKVSTWEIEFESFVNSERCKTISACTPSKHSLRALLIQKDVKQILAASLGIMV